MPSDSTGAAIAQRRGRHPTARSRVTNAAANGLVAWLDGTDKRGPIPRRIADLIDLFSTDLGGPAELTEAQRQIVRRIATMAVWCESQDAKMADGTEIDIDRYQRTANSLRRMCETIGLERQAKDITEDINAYVRRKQAEKAAAAVVDAEMVIDD